MYFFENPVLQRELLTNLRMTRAFALLFAYIALLGAIVYLAWPMDQKIDLTRSVVGQRLVNLFFLGQYILASLMAPSFAAGAITGEKERMSYEMLLASPLRPGAIVIGKLFAALAHLGILMICSLPIVVLCLPLGGIHPSEVFAAYFAMISTVALYGMISLWASSYFGRTSASLVVSYLLILPLALISVLLWNAMGRLGETRLLVVVTVVPIVCISLSALMWRDACRRLLYPPDLGSEGKEVVDLEAEAQEAVGLYIKRDEFPDRWFAPPKRSTFLEDGENPIYDKEMRSEIFSQGTLMLRLVIQISMGLALPIMAVCLFGKPEFAPWYIAYVLLFNMLVGPVFSAGSVTSERERQTLDLLLTTLLTPWQMFLGKFLSGLRVSSVLTSFIVWPVILACILMMPYWSNLLTMLAYLVVVGLCCLTTSQTALFCSTMFHKTSTSLITTYLIILAMFMMPPAATFFADTFFAETQQAKVAHALGIFSPFSATFSLPLHIDDDSTRRAIAVGDQAAVVSNVWIFWGHLLWSVLYNVTLLYGLMWMFRVRWRVSD